MDTIIDAIHHTKRLSIVYKGSTRLIEPHATGSGKLRAYQLGDGEGWKLFLLSGISDVTFANAHFIGPRPGYKMGDSAMASIDAELRL